MNDNLDGILAKFFDRRSRQLWDRFPGHYRAVVVETNDPLQAHRVRFKCPDMHDWTLPADHCPWAVVDSQLGGKGAGSWDHPCIGDWVWVTFERNHPYGPIVSGFANPTRRSMYALPSVFGETPLPVDQDGRPARRRDDFVQAYLPKDGRPMSSGKLTRYGNMDMSSAVGFFPTEHIEPPPDPDFDAVQHANFDQAQAKPEINDPDIKYMLRQTKYGMMAIASDVGYHWHREDDIPEPAAPADPEVIDPPIGVDPGDGVGIAGDSASNEDDLGEFWGDFLADEKFEIKRWKYLQRLHNEDAPKGEDQRRMQWWTRYGSKIEMRDTGWAQCGPIESKSRQDEYDDPRFLSKETEKDFRWIKIRSKGGWLFQAYDKGFHPQDDLFIKRKLIDEVGDKTENEHELWKDKDARWMRMVGRHGIKFVIDERGTSPTDADRQESPRANGILMKGRRSPGCQARSSDSGDEKGFFWEFNENDETNQTTWGSPLGQTIRINDNHQYIYLSSRRKDYPRPFQGLKENEFLLESLISDDHERKSHHMKLDLHNEYIRFKTRAAKGDGPCGSPVNPVQLSGTAIQQGIEARDGSKDDGPWTEVVDSGERNLWFWGKGNLVMCHARRIPDPVNMMWWMNENTKELVIRLDETSGKLQIFSQSPIEIIGRDTINVHAAQELTVRSDDKVTLTSGGSSFEVNRAQIIANKEIRAPGFTRANPNVNPLPPPQEIQEPRLSPKDRGKRYNDALDKPADKDEIEHPTNP